jgi:hypothetical protein
VCRRPIAAQEDVLSLEGEGSGGVPRLQCHRRDGEASLYWVGRTLGQALRRATQFRWYPDSKKSRSLTEERMVLAGLILVISTALAAFYLLVTVQRILRTAIRHK